MGNSKRGELELAGAQEELRRSQLHCSLCTVQKEHMQREENSAADRGQQDMHKLKEV